MEAGRDELIELVKRLDGRYIPDTSQDRMSDWEAMRIHTFRDGQVISRVPRRYEQYGVSQPMMSRRTGGDVAGQDDPYVTGARRRGLLPGHFPQPDHPRGDGARAQRAHRHQGAQVAHPRLRGLHLRPQPGRVQAVVEASRRSNAAIYFLNARGPGGDAHLHDRAVRSPPARAGHRLRLQRRPTRRRKAPTPWPRTAAASASATPTTSQRASSASPTRTAPTTWSATTPRTPRATASSARSP